MKDKHMNMAAVLKTVLICCYTTRIFSMPISTDRTFLVDDENEVEFTLDSLITGFRKQQMYMSTSLLNASIGLRVPQKLAEAQRQEAEERKAKAFRAKNEAMTPFIATSSQLNLGYIGRGYDIYSGNPLSDDGVVDQGFRLPVIDLPFSFRFTSDGAYRIPDNVDVISETSASFSSSYVQVKTESDYKRMLNVDASISGHASGFGFQGSFSASTSYNKATQEIQKGETTTINTIGRAIVYRARLSETAKISKVSDYFESAIKALPMEHCEEDNMQDLYIRVIEEFGTHFTTEVVMGAKAIQELRFRNSDLDKLSSEGISASVAASFSYSGIGSAGVSVGLGFGSKEDQRKRIENTSKEEREYYIGGKPPTGNFEKGSTESLREWARSAAENPAPIQYKLSSIDSLLVPDSFKDLNYGLYERRECLRKALFRYCSRVISPNICTPNSRSTSRRKKRSADDDIKQEARTVKFGDFVKVRHSNRYLVLSKDYGLVPGLPIKPLKSGAQIQNYDGLFQLMPLEDEYNKVGSDIRYGEPFTLQTIEGSAMFMGKTIMENTASPSEAKSMDLFDDRDEKTDGSIWNDQISDFTVFLKKDGLSTYMVSLRVECYVSKPQTFMVDIRGTDGSLNAQFYTSCKCSGHYGVLCGVKWFHRIVIQNDIKELKSIYLMGMRGDKTDPIKGIQIRIITNGQKRRIIKDPLRCKGREFTITTIPSPETKRIGLNIYPVKFSFQSKDKLLTEGEPVRDRDVGYISILTSMQTQTFWGHPSTRVIAVGPDGQITIKEQGPADHKRVSSECDNLIYPSSVNLAQIHKPVEGIIVSFTVPVVVTYIEVEATLKLYLNFSLSYIANGGNYFKRISESMLVRSTVGSNSINISFEKSVHSSALKIYHPGISQVNISNFIKLVSIGGCASAVIEKSNNDSTEAEWSVEISENEIKTYPYLQIVPKYREINDFEKIFRDIETPVTLPVSMTVQIPSEKEHCEFHEPYLMDFLTHSGNTAFLKFDNIELTRHTRQEVKSRLTVNIDVTAINADELDLGLLNLNSTLQSAVSVYPCNRKTTKTSPHQSDLSLSSNTSVFNTTSSGIIGCLSLLVIVLAVFIACLIYRQHRSSFIQGSNESHMLENRTYGLEDDNNDRTVETAYENVENTGMRTNGTVDTTHDNVENTGAF